MWAVVTARDAQYEWMSGDIITYQHVFLKETTWFNSGLKPAAAGLREVGLTATVCAIRSALDLVERIRPTTVWTAEDLKSTSIGVLDICEATMGHSPQAAFRRGVPSGGPRISDTY